MHFTGGHIGERHAIAGVSILSEDFRAFHKEDVVFKHVAVAVSILSEDFRAFHLVAAQVPRQLLAFQSSARISVHFTDVAVARRGGLASDVSILSEDFRAFHGSTPCWGAMCCNVSILSEDFRAFHLGYSTLTAEFPQCFNPQRGFPCISPVDAEGELEVPSICFNPQRGFPCISRCVRPPRAASV